MKLTKDQKELLQDFYYKQKNFFGRDKIFHSLKHLPNAPTQVQVAEWLKRQEVNQLHTKPKKTSSIKPILPEAIGEYFQADLIDMGQKNISNKKRYILVVIDSLSRKSYVLPLAQKTEDKLKDGFEKIFEKIQADGGHPKILQTDNGTEFVNKKIKAFLNGQHIKHLTGVAGRPQSQGIVERFNGTLKSLIEKDKTVTHNKWTTNLQELNKNYNNSYHSTIGTTPNQAAEKIQEVVNKIKKRISYIRPKNDTKLERGDRVRLKIFKGPLEKKSKQNFSKDIYYIVKINKSTKPYVAETYSISDGENMLKNKYLANDLLLVPEDD